MAKAILLADDSEDDEALFKLVLTRVGVKNPVYVVRDGARAIAYLDGEGEFADRNRHPLPEILVLDLKMPNIDGFAVLEWLQAKAALKKELLVIVLTQFGDASQIRRAYDLGANSFLQKPFSEEDLKNLIRHFDGRWLNAGAQQ